MGGTKDGRWGFVNDNGVGDCVYGNGLTVTMVVLYRVIDLVVVRAWAASGDKRALDVAYERVLESEQFEGVDLALCRWLSEGSTGIKVYVIVVLSANNPLKLDSSSRNQIWKRNGFIIEHTT